MEIVRVIRIRFIRNCMTTKHTHTADKRNGGRETFGTTANDDDDGRHAAYHAQADRIATSSATQPELRSHTNGINHIFGVRVRELVHFGSTCGKETNRGEKHTSDRCGKKNNENA